MSDTISVESRTSRWLSPLILFFATMLLIGATSKDYGVTWDEPPYFHATDLHMRWLADSMENMIWGELRKSLDDQTIKDAWHWNPYNVPHPPFSRIVSGFARYISSLFLGKISAYRLGPALFFALLVTVMFVWMKELFGRATGLFSALAVILTPNLFGYAHIAVTDLPLATMWFLTTYSFWKGLGSWKWSVALGIVWGLALATKFPALLIPAPLILWAHLFHRDKYVNNLFALLSLAPIVMVATQPYLWHQTGLRVLEFLYEGISRGYRLETNFGVFFFNQILQSNQLPWYYSFFLVGVTTPEPIAILALLGMASLVWSKEQRSAGVLLSANAGLILLLGLMPGAVLHDGVRQMLPALPFIAALAGVGFYRIAVALQRFAQNNLALRSIEKIDVKVLAILFILVSFSPALDLYLSHPFQLSFYNRFVGGIRGAYLHGLETTYFMEAFTPAFLRTMNERIPANASINAAFANFMFGYYQKEGLLRRDIKIIDGKASDYLVLLNRRSALSPRQRHLIDGAAKPYISITVAGVPLVSVFEFSSSITSNAK